MTPNPKLKIEKRMREEIDGIRKIADLLPTGKRHALINKLGKLSSLAVKAQAIADAHLYAPTHAGYDARTTDRKDLPWEMCDEWVRPEGTRPFKQYWLIPKEKEGPVC